MLVHGNGDFFGQPFRLTLDEKRFIYRLYEYDPVTGNRKHRRALKGMPKGNGKTEIAAAIGCVELGLKPFNPVPDIPVGAASFEQADLLFGTMGIMVSEGPLSDFFDVFDTEIMPKEGPGRAYRVAAAAGTNDGGRPTCFLADEVHEWTDRKERVHLVLSNGLSKRQNGLELNISTAGSDLESLLGKLYTYGKQVESGEIKDEGFLFDWLEAPADFDIETEEGRRAAVLACNPGADVFWPLENVLRRFHEIPTYEWLRYHCNRWTASEKAWLPTGAWRKLGTKKKVQPGDEVVLAFDGSYNNDSTALVGCRVKDRHVFVVGAWEKPADADKWQVPRDEVETTLHKAMRDFKVVELAPDTGPYGGWHREIQEWEERYGEDVVVGYPTNSRPRMAEACSRFYSAVVTEALTHDDDERLARHLSNAIVKETSEGAYITKDGRMSPRKIDLAIAAVIAVERATWRREETDSVYESRGLVTL